MEVSVRVKNTGSLAGDEVVQLYVSNKDASVPVPIRSLKGFDRIYLLPGESKTVSFTIDPDAFSVIDENNKRVIRTGKFLITAGGQQPSKDSAEKGILKKVVSVL